VALCRITKIEPQRRRKSRFSVFVNGEYSFSLDAELLASVGLAEGQEIDEARLEQIRRESELRYARERAYRLLAVRDRSEAEMRQRLTRIGFDPATVEMTIGFLKERKYLDDRSFALRYAQSEVALHPVGRRELERRLRQKGLEEGVVREVVGHLLPPGEEAALAWQEALRRYRRYRNEPDREKVKARVVSFLARRGFEWPILQDILERWQELEQQAQRELGEDGESEHDIG